MLAACCLDGIPTELRLCWSLEETLVVGASGLDFRISSLCFLLEEVSSCSLLQVDAEVGGFPF